MQPPSAISRSSKRSRLSRPIATGNAYAAASKKAALLTAFTGSSQKPGAVRSQYRSMNRGLSMEASLRMASRRIKLVRPKWNASGDLPSAAGSASIPGGSSSRKRACPLEKKSQFAANETCPRNAGRRRASGTKENSFGTADFRFPGKDPVNLHGTKSRSVRCRRAKTPGGLKIGF